MSQLAFKDKLSRLLERLAYPCVLFAWNVLPLSIKARLIGAGLPTGILDYSKKKLRLAVSSREALKRLRSCRKEPSTIAWIEKSMADGGVFFDIGANVGAYSLVAAAQEKAHARIYSFEPGYSTFPLLCDNVGLNGFGGQITPLAIALSGDTAIKEFSYANTRAGAASQPGLESALGSLNLPVPVFSLDDFVAKAKLPAPTMIKIDVDGHEEQVISGAAKTLRLLGLKTVQIEFSEDPQKEARIVEKMREAGLSLAARNQHRSGGTRDGVFVRS